VLAVGLTGGMGSGKSTVALLLVERGAKLVDADAIAREVVEPGRPAYGRLVERFGPGIVSADGTIDRPALAAVAFAGPESVADLNAITHPAIAQEMAARRAALEESDDVVLLDVPLLAPEHRGVLALDAVLVVDCDADTAVERVVTQRGIPEWDVRARLAAQVGREERLRGADLVVDNCGDRAALEAEVERVWTALRAMAEAKAAGRARGGGAARG
jgi:dephospho-CoA kinase